VLKLDNATQQELLALLAPPLRREDEREGFLALALGMDCPVLGRIDWSGAVEPFVLRMVGELARFGEAEPGKQALWKLLEAVGTRVGTDLQARIDALAPIVNRPSEPAEIAAAGDLSAAPATPTHLRVFLASPGDVSHERGLALGVLEQLPYDPLLRGQVTLEAVAWDKPGAGTPMLATMTPQAAIAAGLPKPSQCDIVVVILWSRMGTPLPADYRKPDGSGYASGTEWEYLDALDAAQRTGHPDILVYRRTERCLLDPDDPEFEDSLRQRRSVDAFFAGFRHADGSIRGGYNPYQAPEAFGRQLDLHLRALIGRALQRRTAAAPARAQPAQVRQPALWRGSPFPGLRAFTPDDAPIFFGRGRETDELVRRLAEGCRFLAVVGASGSGKSSLVAAGLLPRLKNNAVEGAKDWLLPNTVSAGPGEGKLWRGLRFTPGELGDDPFVALAAKLAPLLPGVTAPAQLARKLAGEPAAIAQYAEQVLANGHGVSATPENVSRCRHDRFPHPGPLPEGEGDVGRAARDFHGKLPAWAEVLLLVDQFEELLTVVAAPHRQAFIDLLAVAAGVPRVRVLVTMRADFYHRWLDWPQLPEALRTAPAPVVAPGLAALFQTVTGPAARAGLELEEGLAARILEDTGTDPGALALLAFALHELYEKRTESGGLTHTAYDGFGGVRGAISRRAESTFAGLSADARALLGGVFRELVEADERGVATRRRVSRARLAASAAATQLIDAFTDARLLVTDRGPDGQPVVEVAHEALFREWPRLRDWIGERADDLRALRQAEAAAHQWRQAGRPAGRRVICGRTSVSSPSRRRWSTWAWRGRTWTSQPGPSCAPRRSGCSRSWSGRRRLTIGAPGSATAWTLSATPARVLVCGRTACRTSSGAPFLPARSASKGSRAASASNLSSSPSTPSPIASTGPSWRPRTATGTTAGGRDCSIRNHGETNIGRPTTTQPRMSPGSMRWPFAGG
jgi:hypothetical protein